MEVSEHGANYFPHSACFIKGQCKGKATLKWWRKALLGALAVCLASAAALAQDILLSDFEQANYAWLPGGVWTTTGTAFGSGPAPGTLPDQQALDGYLGDRTVNSYLNGDGSTGTLTSPPFTIQRKYIRFLIGGGNWRGRTCMNLLVNGQVVRSAVGMGDREHLDWLQWNVSSLSHQTAQIQIVDTATGNWGHINVDQILQTDSSLSSVVTLTNRYLCLPVKTGAPRHLFELVVEGLVTHEFFIELADTVTPEFYSFLDLSDFQGKQALVRVDSAAATAASLGSLVWSNGIAEANTFYQEANRPIYHFTARRGWLNDPNGLIYFNGQYHLGYQHNPYGWTWANMHWGHAVSPDLVHWQEQPEWLYPDPLGAEWSGSAVRDWNNSAGFGTNALIAFYTGAAKGADPNLPRMANTGQFTQCMAYSLDAGRTWTKYTNNPVVPNLLGGDNRDPKVLWYAPANKWVMVLWLINNDYGIFSSADLKNWTQTSTFTFPGVIEVPDLYELPLDGNAANKKWIFWGGGGNYYLGAFDGDKFTPESGPFLLRGGDCFAVTQTYNNIPGDARRILIVHGTIQFPGMPFNNNLNFPIDLTLRASPSGARLYANPVAELALLRTCTNTWPAQAMVSGNNVTAGTVGEAFELDATFRPGTAKSVSFGLRGTSVTYDCAAGTVTCSGMTQVLAPSNGLVRLQMLVDRGIIEIFGNDGLLYMPMRVTPSSGALPVTVMADGSGATLTSLAKYDLGSAWNGAGPSITPPDPVTANPIAYWRMENQITAPNNEGHPTWPGVADEAVKAGQGEYATGSLPAEIDDLITFNGLAGQPVTLSTEVAPAAMFVNGRSAGGFSYDAGAISNVDGCLFFPQDQYGDEMDFPGSFSLEMFFKTQGEQSQAGAMQLLSQGSDTGQVFRYGLDLNTAGRGAARFTLANSSLAASQRAELAATNYADGQWHYLLAVCDTLGGAYGQMRLTIVNQDGSEATATNELPAAFLPLPAQNNGNLFLGRLTYPVNQDPRTFLGFIDEVQITSGVVPDGRRVGKIPSLDSHPRIKSASLGTNGFSFQWMGAAANSFAIQWVLSLGDEWQTIAVLPSASSSAGFVDTNPARIAGPQSFYRVVSL